MTLVELNRRLGALEEAQRALDARLRRLESVLLVDPGGAAREEVRLAAADPRREPDERTSAPSVPIAAIPNGLVRRATRELERARRTSERLERVVDDIARRELDGEEPKR